MLQFGLITTKAFSNIVDFKILNWDPRMDSELNKD